MSQDPIHFHWQFLTSLGVAGPPLMGRAAGKADVLEEEGTDAIGFSAQDVGPLDEVGFDVGPDEGSGGLLDGWDRWTDSATDGKTGTISDAARDQVAELHALAAILADGPETTDRSVQVKPGLGKIMMRLIRSVQMDPLPLPEGRVFGVREAEPPDEVTAVERVWEMDGQAGPSGLQEVTSQTHAVQTDPLLSRENTDVTRPVVSREKPGLPPIVVFGLGVMFALAGGVLFLLATTFGNGRFGGP